MVPFTLIMSVDFDELCVPPTVKLLDQWSGVDINEPRLNNETPVPHNSTQSHRGN